MQDFFGGFVYNLSTKLLAYNLTEDASRFLFHLVRVMRIEILRDRRIRMAEAGGYIDGFCTCFNEFCRVRMAEAVRVEVEIPQQRFYARVLVRESAWQDAEERAADMVGGRGQLLRKDYEPVILCRFIDDLIRFAESHFLLRLCCFERAEVGK